MKVIIRKFGKDVFMNEGLTDCMVLGGEQIFLLTVGVRVVADCEAIIF